MNQQSVLDKYPSGNGVLANNIFYFPIASGSGFVAGSNITGGATEVESYVMANNTVIREAASAAKNTELGINNDWYIGSRLVTDYPANPNFTLTSGTAATGADFSNAKLNGFQQVSYRGAFGATDWTDGWANFAPVNTIY